MISTSLSRRLAAGLLFFGLCLMPVLAQESKGDGSVPAGPALSEAELIILLQAKVPLETIEHFVSIRGVNFVCTKETSKKILAAGGNVSLVGTINLNQKDDMNAMAAAAAASANGNKKKK